MFQQDSSIFCGDCGKEVVHGICPSCNTEADTFVKNHFTGTTFVAPTCPLCTTPLAENCTFCSKCGHNVSINDTGATFVKNPCRKCGYGIDPESTFCGRCGSSTTDSITGTEYIYPTGTHENNVAQENSDTTFVRIPEQTKQNITNTTLDSAISGAKNNVMRTKCSFVSSLVQTCNKIDIDIELLSSVGLLSFSTIGVLLYAFMCLAVTNSTWRIGVSVLELLLVVLFVCGISTPTRRKRLTIKAALVTGLVIAFGTNAMGAIIALILMLSTPSGMLLVWISVGYLIGALYTYGFLLSNFSKKHKFIVIPYGTELLDGTVIDSVRMSTGKTSEDINAKKVFLPKDTMLLAGTSFPKGTVPDKDFSIGSYKNYADEKSRGEESFKKEKRFLMNYTLVTETYIIEDLELSFR